MRYRKLPLLIALTISLTVLIRNVSAQSLSDFKWDDFVGQVTKQEVQTHTDPFTGGVSSADDLAIEELQLAGIVYRNEDDAFALISGYLVKPGDRIAGYRVDLIEKDKVQLKRVDDIFVMALGGGI